MKVVPKISVTVPVYKAEAYLRKCIDSLLAQTLTDFELILVDDGSPDNSPMICDQYMYKDTRVRVIHQGNSGVSAARNSGIRHAQGDYLVFVDSDDYVDASYLEMLYKGFDSDADIAICGYYTVWTNRPSSVHIDPTRPAEYAGDLSGVFKNMIEHDLLYSPFNKMYKTKVLKNNHIFFDETMTLGEDLCFNIAYLHYCETCYLCNVPLYYYVKSNSTLSNNIPLNYFNIQKRLYETIGEFIISKQIKYEFSRELENLLMDTLGNLAISKTPTNKQQIGIKLQEVLQDDLTTKYLDKTPGNILHLLLKSKSIFLILNYFNAKHKIGKLLKRERPL